MAGYIKGITIQIDGETRNTCAARKQGGRIMNIFFEPVNLNQWNMFEKVQGEGHVEPFLATKAMEEGDIVLLHVGQQIRQCKSGIYAYGTVINGPYILENSPADYCNNKNTVDVRIDKIVYGESMVSHEESKKFIRQFRTVHKIDEQFYDEILRILGL